MVPIISLLLILMISLIVTRVATVALMHTGLSKETAQFQARSAFSGVGYTTMESEKIVNHPVRRRIILTLMLLGNAGVVTVIASLLLAFVNVAQGGSPYRRLGVLVAGVLAFWLLANSRLVERWMARVITWGLRRWTDLDTRDYCSLLHLADDHQILEMQVEPGDWLAGRTLAELALADEGVIVIGIQPPRNSFLGAPHGATRIEAGDRIIVYGRSGPLKELDSRETGHSGDLAHAEAVSRQQQVLRQQKELEKKRQE